MTGIFSSDPSMRNRRDDTAATRYEKMVPVATKYNIIQVGVCTFHRDSIGNLEACPFNFYVFPEDGPDVVMSTKSIGTSSLLP